MYPFPYSIYHIHILVSRNKVPYHIYSLPYSIYQIHILVSIYTKYHTKNTLSHIFYIPKVTS